MIVHFTETELQKLTIQPVAPRECSPEYIAEREQVWTAQMEVVRARGGKMWNGELYTLESIRSPEEGQVVFSMSTCEYKDLMFRFVKGPDHVVARYGEAHAFNFTGVNCVPVTLDGKYVFGIRADRAEPMIGGIGGNLNKDELEIHTFADIRLSMLKEIHEETALECMADDLRFFGLHISAGIHLFWFTTRLPVHSEEIPRYHRPGEFSRLLAMTLEETRQTNIPTSNAFKRWQPYLHLL